MRRAPCGARRKGTACGVSAAGGCAAFPLRGGAFPFGGRALDRLAGAFPFGGRAFIRLAAPAHLKRISFGLSYCAFLLVRFFSTR